MPADRDAAIRLICRRLRVANEAGLPAYVRERIEGEIRPLLASPLVAPDDPLVLQAAEGIARDWNVLRAVTAIAQRLEASAQARPQPAHAPAPQRRRPAAPAQGQPQPKPAPPVQARSPQRPAQPRPAAHPQAPQKPPAPAKKASLWQGIVQFLPWLAGK